jgi:hypothetical protein
MNPNFILLTALLLAPLTALAAADASPCAAVRCPPDIKQEDYSGWPMKNPVRQIFRLNQTYTWLREPLLRRLPDGSLCCVFFTGGAGDGHIRNVVAAIRSDDDGKTWSDVEILASRPNQGCWAPSMFVHKNKAHLFWFTKSTGFRDMTNRLMSTGADGRTFGDDREILQGWQAENRQAAIDAIDVRHGTHLRDGRVLLPIAWQEPLDKSDPWRPSREADLRNIGGEPARRNVHYVGVMEPNDDFTEFTRYGRICHRTPDGPTPSVPLFENAIAELPDGKLAMLIRADTTNRLWRSDSSDGGRTWSSAYPTGIPNPGSKPRLINLPDKRIVLFHNPSEKSFTDTRSHHHASRTPLEMWVSSDGMQSWYLKRTIVSAPKIAMYPDAFYEENTQAIYLAWEDGETIFFQIILLEELA